jgi:hypothetical protein
MITSENYLMEMVVAVDGEQEMMIYLFYYLDWLILYLFVLYFYKVDVGYEGMDLHALIYIIDVSFSIYFIVIVILISFVIIISYFSLLVVYIHTCIIHIFLLIIIIILFLSCMLSIFIAKY